MYWLPKLRKTPVGTKPLSGVISKIFKMIFKHVDNFHNKSTFYSSYKKFWVVENSSSIIEKLNIINTRKRAKKISTYDFSTLHTTVPHNLIIKVVSEKIHFVFESKVRSEIGFSATSIYWTSKGVGKKYEIKKNYALNQKLLFYYRKYGVQTRYWNPCGY